MIEIITDTTLTRWRLEEKSKIKNKYKNLQINLYIKKTQNRLYWFQVTAVCRQVTIREVVAGGEPLKSYVTEYFLLRHIKITKLPTSYNGTIYKDI